MVLECIAFAEHTPLDRQALHVQGLSYWAPANIGPYSQAITVCFPPPICLDPPHLRLQVGERVFISGQIGLISSQLTMPSTSLAMEVALSSQHVSRITAALRECAGGGWEGHTMLNTYWFRSSCSLSHLKQGHLALKVFCISVFCHMETGHAPRYLNLRLSSCKLRSYLRTPLLKSRYTFIREGSKE